MESGMSGHEEIAERHLEEMSDDELDRDWKLEEFFGKIVVINLPQEKERLKQITEELHNVGSNNFEVFPAVDGQKDIEETLWKKFKLNWANIDTSTELGKRNLDRLHRAEAGCYLSHYYIIKKMWKDFKQAQENLFQARTELEKTAALCVLKKVSSVLVLEDDNGFGFVDKSKTQIMKRNAGRLFREAMRELPDDWDMLYLMAKPIKDPLMFISPHLLRFGDFRCTNAIAIHHKMYQPIVESLGKIEDPMVDEVLPIDSVYGQLNKHYNCYAIAPPIAFQHRGVSAITLESKDLLRQ